jgi:hypothetical protein
VRARVERVRAPHRAEPHGTDHGSQGAMLAIGGRERRRVRQPPRHRGRVARRLRNTVYTQAAARSAPLDGLSRRLRHGPEALARHGRGDDRRDGPPLRRPAARPTTGRRRTSISASCSPPGAARRLLPRRPTPDADPIEHLGPGGMSAELAALLADGAGWTPARVALFDAGFRLYWDARLRPRASARGRGCRRGCRTSRSQRSRTTIRRTSSC